MMNLSVLSFSSSPGVSTFYKLTNVTFRLIVEKPVPVVPKAPPISAAYESKVWSLANWTKQQYSPPFPVLNLRGWICRTSHHRSKLWWSVCLCTWWTVVLLVSYIPAATFPFLLSPVVNSKLNAVLYYEWQQLQSGQETVTQPQYEISFLQPVIRLKRERYLER